MASDPTREQPAPDAGRVEPLECREPHGGPDPEVGDPGDLDLPEVPSPGASGPGQDGYEGKATVGDEGAAAGPESFGDPFGRPD